MFANDLKIGLEMEDKVANYYRSVGFEVVKSIGYNKFFDMKITQGVEVKYDLKAPQTGNFAIEMRCNGNWSGLATTKARIWNLATSEGVWEVETKMLKDWVKMYGTDKNGKWTFVRGGDNKASELILIDYAWVRCLKQIL